MRPGWCRSRTASINLTRPLADQAVAARQAFAIRLRDLRKDADLTGRELAALTGLHNTKISRIEHALQNPSEDDIRAWCIACGVARRIPELIAAHREVEQMWASITHGRRWVGRVRQDPHVPAERGKSSGVPVWRRVETSGRATLVAQRIGHRAAARYLV